VSVTRAPRAASVLETAALVPVLRLFALALTPVLVQERQLARPVQVLAPVSRLLFAVASKLVLVLER
jgi:hypothetical protein